MIEPENDKKTLYIICFEESKIVFDCRDQIVRFPIIVKNKNIYKYSTDDYASSAFNKRKKLFIA